MRLGLLVVVVAASCSVSQQLTLTDGGVPLTIGFDNRTSLEDEASDMVMVPVSLNEISSLSITVDYQIRDGMATRGLDYEGDDGTLMFLPGEKTKYVPVRILPDNNEEGDETIELDLKRANGAKLEGQDHTITINSDILPRVRFTLGSSKELETVSQQFNLALDVPSAVEVRVGYAITGRAKAPEDHMLLAGTVVFPPGIVTQQIMFTPVDDALDEDPEDVVVTLENPVEVIIKPNEGVRTHVLDDNDPTPTIAFTVASSTATEGPNVTVNLTLALSAVSGRNVTVPFAATFPQANPASATDFTYVTQSPLVILAGTPMTNITITVENDDLDEFNESFSTALGALVNADPGATTSYALSITDEDPPPSVSFDPMEANGAGAEDGAVTSYKVKLSVPSGKPISVPIAFSGTATFLGATLDFSVAGAPVMFAPGDVEELVTIDPIADILPELDETVIMDIGMPLNDVTLGSPATRTHTITNDDL